MIFRSPLLAFYMLDQSGFTGEWEYKLSQRKTTYSAGKEQSHEENIQGLKVLITELRKTKYSHSLSPTIVFSASSVDVHDNICFDILQDRWSSVWCRKVPLETCMHKVTEESTKREAVWSEK
ncbi:hypothetical protein HA466_0028720 [Hirschfeldia incana]|nr:hypothetical protein HA466_0028720 [Hirschfeldia incana]